MAWNPQPPTSPALCDQRDDFTHAASSLMASQVWTRQQKFKSGVWAAACAAVIFAGTLTGAQLKTDRQKEEAIQEFRAVRPAEQIAMLEARRTLLLDQRGMLQRKLDVFRDGLRDKELQKTSGAKK